MDTSGICLGRFSLRLGCDAGAHALVSRARGVTVIAMKQAATRVVTVAGAVALMSLPSAAHAGSVTVTDERGDIFPSWEISDIVSATVTYDKTRLTIAVEHSEWLANWKRYRSATGGKITFSNGRSYIITSGMGGRKSVLTTLGQFRACDPLGAPAAPCRTLPCTGWTYSIDKAQLRTAVSIPVRCFPKASAKVKVLPFHVIVDFESARVIDPIATTPWIRRG